MFTLTRSPANPVLVPNPKNSWEAKAVFNGCPVKKDQKYYLFYRAISFSGLSTIGQATSKDGLRFGHRKQFIKPEYHWEKFGCEDPRVTKLNNQYFIFYTALADWPPSPAGIKLGVALSKDLKRISQKHPVTDFNSKAMALFPQKIKGKIAAILTANTDQPPAKIGIAFFDDQSQIWSKDYWDDWYFCLDNHLLPLPREENDQIEVGAPPLATKDGWLLVYCHIKNYLAGSGLFGLKAALLDLKNPQKVLGVTPRPLLVPQEKYELYGQVPRVVFPSGAIVEKDRLLVYYGAADTSCCLAHCSLKSLIRKIKR